MTSFPEIADFTQAPFLPRAKCAQSKPLPGGCAAPRRHPLFAIVAVPFDAFQALPRPEHRWLLTCLGRYADRAGAASRRCASSPPTPASHWQASAAVWPSWRELEVFHRAAPAWRALSSTVLAEAYRRAGRACWHGVFQPRNRVFHRAETTEEVEPTKQSRGARAREFANRKVSFGEMPDERGQMAGAAAVAGGNRGSGCRCGVRSRPSRAASRRLEVLQGIRQSG